MEMFSPDASKSKHKSLIELDTPQRQHSLAEWILEALVISISIFIASLVF